MHWFAFPFVLFFSYFLFSICSQLSTICVCKFNSAYISSLIFNDVIHIHPESVTWDIDISVTA